MIAPLPLEEAQTRLLGSAFPLGSERIQAKDASGRWLARPVVAARTSPAGDLSAMDGFATAGTGPWRIVGESAAGHPFDGGLSPGEAVRISTGALVPQGGEAVLLREDSMEDGSEVSVAGDQPTANHIRRAGFDFRHGDTVLAAGTAIGPAQLALALAAGRALLDAGRLPRVAVIDTGDELVVDLADAAAGAVPATNGAMLAAMCSEICAEVRRIGPVPDEREALASALESAAGVDVIVTSGGASVGDHDLVRPVLEEWGAAIEFWRVAIRPGKPLLVAKRGDQTIVGLPGNPASAFVTAVLFVLPLLRRLAGATIEHALPMSIPTLLASPCPPGGKRREFLRAVWSAEGIVPLPERDSSAQRTLAAAHALIDRPAGAPPGKVGDLVRAIVL